MNINVKIALSTSVLALFASTPALAKVEVSPYLEVAQVLTADLRNGGDVVTYSSVAAGVDASVSNSRTELQVNYRYERRFGYGSDNIGAQDVHSGLARGAIQVVPNILSFEAGALATRARVDIRGDAPAILNGNVDNITQVYSVYAGPTLTTNVGPLQVAAAYRAGYTKVEGRTTALAAGQPQLDNFDSSINHLVTASVGMETGQLPFGWTVSGAYEREDAEQLDQRFESKGIRGDVVVPVTPVLALVGGVGYEDIQSSQRAPLLTAGGTPVVDGNGRFVTDPTSPRLLAYDQDGIYWDAGVLWKPSSRTTLEARVGRRYGSWSYTGSLAYQLSSATNIGVAVFDNVETFGQQLNDGLARLPTSFTTSRNPLSPQFNGCVFGSGDAGAGGCLNDALSAVNSSVYRTRGVNGQISTQRGRLSAGLGLGYSRRTFSAPTGVGFSVNGLSDQNYYGQADIGYQIDDSSNLSGAVYAGYFDSGIAGAGGVLSTGATGSYSRTFGRRLSATAALGLYSSKVDGFEGDLSAQALLGARYQF